MPRARNDLGRPEVLWADFDHLDASQLLWAPRGTSEAEAHRAQRIRDAVATALSDKQREAVEAYFFEGLSQAAIARRCGVTQQVVHKRLYGTVRGGRRVGGALPRLRDVLSPLMEA
ncbi:MAG: hypothetical protein OXU20_04020 [Myxococcales bacterium]|nr:hypothetical protein [Myxococcales bacterium]MDD9968023.1 hypothetical protein [Myxococcales bacterium]